MFIEYTYLVPLIPMLCFLIIDAPERRIHRYSGSTHLVHHRRSDLLRVSHRRPVPQRRDPVHRVVLDRRHHDAPRILRGRPHLHDDAVLLVHLHPDLRVLHRIHGRGGTQEDEVLRRGLPVPDRAPTCSSDSGPSGTTMETLPPPTRHPQPRRPSWSPVSETCA